jgi:hypothetical protein
MSWGENGSCPDCGAKRGQKHSIGCEWDQCPVCGIQAIQCFEHCYREDGHPRLSFIRGRIRMKDWETILKDQQMYRRSLAIVEPKEELKEEP